MSDVKHARLTVQRGDLTEYPLAERVPGGWQNGVTFYPDADVVEVHALRLAPALDSAPPVPSDSDREAWADDDLYGVIDRAMQRSWTDAAGYDYAPSEITAAVQTWMDEQGFRRSPAPEQVSTEATVLGIKSWRYGEPPEFAGQQVSTVEELAALPITSVVLDVFAAVCVRASDSAGALDWRRVTPAVRGGEHRHFPYLPATVLYRPEGGEE